MPLISTFGSAGSQSFGTRGIQVGGSALFNALGDRLLFPSSTAFNYGTGNFTIETWIYPTANNTTRIIWKHSNSTYFCTINGGQLYYVPGNGSYAIAAAPTLNAWNHVAVVRNNNQTRVFLNGVAYAPIFDAVNLGTVSPVLGNYQPSGSGSNQFLGSITNFRISKQALYTENFIPSRTPFTRTSQGSSTTSLLLNMRTAATVATDSSVNNLLATNNSVTFSTETPYTLPFITPPTVVVSSAVVTSSTTTPSEGTTITVDVVGTNTPNGTYFYSLEEEFATGAVTGADFTSGSLTGSFTINGNIGSFPLTITQDLLTEGTETFAIYVRTGSTSGEIIGASAEIAIQDTSITPVFTVTPASINEGSAGSFTVANVGPNGTYFFTVENVSTTNADFVAASGSFTVSGSSGGIDNGSGSFTVTPVADRITEGNETFRVQVRSGSTSGPVVITSSNVTVSDISLTPAFTVTPASINEGSSGTFTVNNLGSAGTYFFTVLNGTTDNADFTATSGSFTTSTLNGSGSFNITPVADRVTEGSQTFQVQIRTSSTSGPVILTSASVTINDISLTPAFTVTPASINEGASGTFTVNNLGPAGTYFFTVLNSTTADADFSAVSGSFTTSTLNGSGSFNITTVNDFVTEGAQTFQVQVREGSISGTVLVTSASVTVNDTSTTVTASGSPTSFDEGASTTITASATGFPNGTYFWTILNGTTTNADFVASSGSFTVSNGTSGAFTVTSVTGDGSETSEFFQVQIRTGSTSGTVIATTGTLTINTNLT
jgi:hypothetical protein